MSGLTVTEWNSTDADIRIGFYYGDHADGMSFDGPGNTIAHAFYPENGNVHFDASERWSLDSEQGNEIVGDCSMNKLGDELIKRARDDWINWRVDW